MEDLSADPDYQAEIREMTRRIELWKASNPATPAAAQAGAPEIDQPNVPRDRAAAERDMRQYIRRMMDEYLDRLARVALRFIAN